MDIIEARHVRNIAQRTKQIEKVIGDAITDITRRFTTTKGRRFATVMTDRLEQLHDQVLTATESGIRNQWMLANTMNNRGLDGYLANVAIAEGLQQSFRAPNISALNSFMDRRDYGMNLSDRVWNFTNGVKSEMDSILGSGVLSGKSAIALSKDLKKYIKGKPIPYQGTLIKGKNLNYQAMRLAATEMNMAFRMSDYLQNSKQPFVTGVTVHLSPAHPIYDICNDLQGQYPKGFYFVGWHPLCICFATYDTLSPQEFVKYIKTNKIDPRHFTRKVPKAAQAYLNKNGQRFLNYKNPPYWLRDNFTKGLELRATALPTGLTHSMPMAPKPGTSTSETVTAQTVEWQPAMRRADADLWSENSKIKQIQLHATKAGNVNSITKNGFRPGTAAEGLGDVWGEGVYVTPTKSVADFYVKELGGTNSARIVNLKINVKKPLTVTIDPKIAIDRQVNALTRIRIIEEAGYTRQQIKKIITEQYNLTKEAARIMGTDPKRMGSYINSYTTKDLVQKKGYDAIHVIEKTFTEGIGGTQTVVFDPKNVVVIKPRASRAIRGLALDPAHTPTVKAKVNAPGRVNPATKAYKKGEYEKVMTNGKVDSYRLLDPHEGYELPTTASQGMNQTAKIKIKGNGSAAFKPISGESAHHTGFVGGSLAPRERAAYLISEEIGLNNVPTTVMRTVNGKRGSAQLWKTGELQGNSIISLKQSEEARMEIYDLIIGNRDRHGANALITKKGKLIYIDNGTSMPTRGTGMSRELFSDLHKHADPYIKRLTPADKQLFREATVKLKSPAFRKRLLADGMEASAIDDMYDRIDRLIEKGL